ATFTDAGPLDTHTAAINWGDGTSSSGSVTESGNSGSVTGSHVYAVAGSYTVTLTVTNNDSASVSATRSLTVQQSTHVSLQNGVLLIVGTDGDDQVSINQTGTGTLKVHASFLDQTLTFNVADVSRIEVSLLGGNDHLIVSGNVEIPVFV